MLWISHTAYKKSGRISSTAKVAMNTQIIASKMRQDVALAKTRDKNLEA